MQQWGPVDYGKIEREIFLKPGLSKLLDAAGIAVIAQAEMNSHEGFKS